MSSDGAARVEETHLSTLFFVGDRVFKRKKPIATDFVDFTDVAARRIACRREVDLNRRLAPDVYLGVADLTLDGETLDHFVVMRALPDDRRLGARLDRPDVDDELRRIARLVATFHERAERGPEVDAASGADAVAALWEAGIAQMQQFAGRVVDSAEVARMADLARRYLAGRPSLLDGRVAAGRACDGHGDLQAQDIFCLDDGPRILDCLEFDDRLRFGDVLADVSFLAMDLERLGHPELADRFVEWYRELSGDRWPASLAHLHIAYWAHVRAKVACIRTDQGDPAAADDAGALQQQCLAHLESGEVGLVVVGGNPGTGKSTVARGVAERLGAVVLSSDELRDEVVSDRGAPNDRLDDGRYAPERRDAVYDELLDRAALLLVSGERVVLDASWLDAGRRARARELADRSTATLVELRCTCPPELAAERIRRRAAEGTDASEVTVTIAAALAATADPWPEATEVDTSAPVAEVVDAAVAATPLRPVLFQGEPRW